MTEEMGEKELTIAEDIAAVMDEIDAREEPAEEAVGATAEEVASNEDGVDTSGNEDAGEQEDTDLAEEASEADEDKELVAPENWAQEDKDAFADMDTAGREVLLRSQKNLERGFNRKFEEMAEVRKEHDAIAGIMKDVEPQLRASGLDRAGGIKQLMDAHRVLTTNVEGGVRQILSTYGGDQVRTIIGNFARELGLLDAAGNGQVDDYVDPAVSALNGRLDKIEQHNQQTQTNTEQQRVNEAQGHITAFAEAKDDKGNLLHPDFDKVKTAMGAALSSGTASDMDAAYTQATWANPELREGLIKTQVDQSNQKAGAARKETVSKAKKASRNANSRSVAKGPKASDKSLMEELEASFDEVASR